MAEKSHTKPWQRVSVFIIALLFILTSGALTVAVIIQAASGNGNGNNSQTDSTNCTISQVSGEVLPKPTAKFTNAPVKLIETDDLSKGSGAEAKSGNCLTVKYYGSLADSGKVFDENFTKPTALKFQLGKQQVISGWDIGLAGMKVGGTRRLVLSPDLAYGKAGSPPTIPANSTLVFVVKLLKIN